MSHELTMNKITGLVEMGYAAGVDRWHGLGNEWLATDTQEQKIAKSGMAWSANRSRVRYGVGPAQRTINDKHVLFRSDTKEPLGIVSDKYQVVQPREAIEFFEDLSGAGGFELKTAGTLYGGKKFWATASIGEAATIIGEDKIEGFLLFTSSFEGGATVVTDSTICVVCDNTLRMALDEKNRVEVRINHRSVFDAAAVKAQLGIATGAFAAQLKAARALAKTSMTEEAAANFFAKLLVDVMKMSQNRIDEGKSVGFNKVMGLFNGEGLGATLPGRAGTAWGAVNAVTEYVDHHAAAASAENRMENAWWGDGAALKAAALASALATV